MGSVIADGWERLSRAVPASEVSDEPYPEKPDQLRLLKASLYVASLPLQRIGEDRLEADSDKHC
jgi:hypothetical protein